MRSLFTLTRGVVLFGALTLAPASTALAAGGSSAGTGENTPLHLPSQQVHHHVSSGGAGTIVRTLIALVIVIVIIYAVARVLKAVKGREQRATGDGLRHLATLPLGTNRSVALVRSGSDIVLVGISESGVTPIKTYTEAEAIANGIIPDPEAAEADANRSGSSAEPSFQSFVESLRRMTVRS